MAKAYKLFVLLMKYTQKTSADHLSHSGILIFQTEEILGIKLKFREKSKLRFLQVNRKSSLKSMFHRWGKIGLKRLSNLPKGA